MAIVYAIDQIKSKLTNNIGQNYYQNSFILKEGMHMCQFTKILLSIGLSVLYRVASYSYWPGFYLFWMREGKQSHKRN